MAADTTRKAKIEPELNQNSSPATSSYLADH